MAAALADVPQQEQEQEDQQEQEQEQEQEPEQDSGVATEAAATAGVAELQLEFALSFAVRIYTKIGMDCVLKMLHLCLQLADLRVPPSANINHNM